jgi:MFS family permease
MTTSLAARERHVGEAASAADSAVTASEDGGASSVTAIPVAFAGDTSPGQASSYRRSMLSLAALTTSIFLTFMTIGLPLPVIPLYVGHVLLFGNVVVGLSVGIQFLATVLTRGYAGQQADRAGARRVMLRGMLFCACSGLANVLSAVVPAPDAVRLAVLIAGRLVLGFGESQLIVGMFGWGIGTVGQARSGIVLAWTGMAIYGAIAVGAPIGFWLYGHGGLSLVGAVSVFLPAVAALIAFPVAPVASHKGQRQAFWQVIGSIWQPGLAVLLQGVGFAAIGAFVSLDFASKGWQGTGLALSCFGGAFVLVRLVAGHLPDRIGGSRIAIASLAVEAVGQWMLFAAPNAQIALLGAAITGAGCSMVFPALGLEVVRRVQPQVRSTALGGFAAFQDVAYGVTGPLTGLVATAYGYPAVFAIGALCAVGGLIMVGTIACGALGWRTTP